MKRILSFILTIIFTLSLTACSREQIRDFVDNSAEKVGNIIGYAEDAIRNPDSANKYNPVCEKADEIDAHKTTLTNGTKFDYLKLYEYVQYNTLSSDEKKCYHLLAQAAYKLESEVNVAYLKIKTDRIDEIFHKFVADNPQLFYLAKSFSYGYDPETNVVSTITLCYTDGKTMDKYDSNQKLIKSADKNKIKSDIKTLDNAIKSILSRVNSNSDKEDIEKAIYDYICSNVEYDKALADNAAEELSPSYSFTIYGALCDKLAVCEGYTKAFQYLCYLAGINSTQVSGIGNGGPHMWNMVEIDNKWYHTDVTWGHTYIQGQVSYDFYNLTESEMLSHDHEISQQNLTIPK